MVVGTLILTVTNSSQVTWKGQESIYRPGVQSGGGKTNVVVDMVEVIVVVVVLVVVMVASYLGHELDNFPSSAYCFYKETYGVVVVVASDVIDAAVA